MPTSSGQFSHGMTSRQFARYAVASFCLAATLYFMLYVVNNTVKSPYSEEPKHVVNLDLSSYGNAPNTFVSALPLSNRSKEMEFKNILNRKYGPVTISSIVSVDTTLTADEISRYGDCVRNGPRDRQQKGNRFWGKEAHIRTTHHTYLSNENAVLLDVGGNQGIDASDFVKLYNPRYLILEPLEQYANILKDKFKNNSRVSVVNLGLGKSNEVAFVKIEGYKADATSKFASAGGNTPIYITNAVEFLLKIGAGLFDIDLLTMNCEGCEFEALEAILSSTIVKNLRNIQFATHSTIPGIKDPMGRYCKIQELLSRTHRHTYQYKFIWESWRRLDL